MDRRVLVVMAGLVVAAIASGVSRAQLLMDAPPEEAVGGVGVDEKLGERVPTRLEFVDSLGERAPLARWIDGEKPVIVALGYYRCPVVCPTILRLMTQCFRELDYTVGEDFNVIVASVDPSEGPTHAYREKMRSLGSYDRGTDAASDGWAFLTGEPEQIDALADAVGYRYKLLESGEYSHPVVLAILSPTGKITRYIYGFDYPPRQIKLSLLEASDGKISKSLGDAILHFCYRFDPEAGAYTVAAMQVMRVAGVLTVIALGGFLLIMFGWEHRRRERRARDLDRTDHTRPAAPAPTVIRGFERGLGQSS